MLNRETEVLTSTPTTEHLSRKADTHIPSALLQLLPKPTLEFLLTAPFYVVFAAHKSPGHLYLHQAGSLGGDGE